jgi:hypothetical protein
MVRPAGRVKKPPDNAGGREMRGSYLAVIRYPFKIRRQLIYALCRCSVD